MRRVTETFGSSVGHHNLMQVVGAHTLEEHRKTKGVIQYCNCIKPSYTIIVNAEQIPAQIQGQRGPPTIIQMKTVRSIKCGLPCIQIKFYTIC